MKTNVSYAIDANANTPLVPGEMIRGGSSLLQPFISIMTLWGVERLEANPGTYGQLLLAAPRFRQLKNADTPGWVLAGRRKAMNLLGEFLLLTGISALEIEPSAEELSMIKARWKACEEDYAREQNTEEGAANGSGSPVAGSP
jgi:hypothetical protein